ncbi:uncharacterized protein LOC121265855 [Juglans microcarpa x Juglans regia]|uniref:uncharacterized protein LOC121265855 n=1 Tax=Juglans microcarpa x Juglans regia TaxID=2249226 RepID=UPI001B7F3340|nr:uncharacterized protein LOC121265855 [Juglans microcarpa x Juglans regia]
MELVEQLFDKDEEEDIIAQIPISSSSSSDKMIWKGTSQKIVDHPKCTIFNLEEETTTHALWECELARDVWSQCSKSLQKSHFSQMNMLEIFEAIARTMDTNCLQEFAMVAKQIWWRRNDFIFNQMFKHPNVVVSATYQNLKMLKELEVQRSASSRPNNSSIIEWQAPPMHFHKLNWDAVVDRTRAGVGIGTVVRNYEGKIVATMRRSQCMFRLPSLAEAYGALQVVSFAMDLGLTKVIVEGDSLQTIQALKKEEDQLNYFGMFVSEANLGALLIGMLLMLKGVAMW